MLTAVHCVWIVNMDGAATIVNDCGALIKVEKPTTLTNTEANVAVKKATKGRTATIAAAAATDAYLKMARKSATYHVCAQRIGPGQDATLFYA